AYQYAVSANFGPWNKIECSAPPISLPKHMGCNGDKCEMIAGSGSATCTNDRNCKDKIHNGCDAATQKCVDNIPGVGTDDCTVGDDAECVRQIAIGTAGPPCTATPGTICNAKNEDEGVDTFKPNPGANCAYNAVSRYNSAIDDAVSKVPKSGNINLNAMIKATIAQESKGDLHPPPVCDTTVQGKKICTYGLMQISTSVANQYRNRCGVAQQTEETMPNLTADQQICLGAFYLTDLPGIPADQRDVRTLAAHFNGGGTGSSGGKGALDASQHCSACSMNPQQTTATKRWECQWDDSQHSTCNTGYSNLRKKYVPNVLKCYNEFQK
ncbi:MAG: hypothetical protein Q8R30_01375, partial [bacterium]|nr:hypothetical protein [bacterium]MDZ4285941.1 hypothetical protein [Candidatus Sungbacteria bacterium]